MARSGMVFGGLLAGLGQGITMQAAQLREDALLKLRRQWQQEDAATAEDNQIAQETREEERAVRTDERRGTDLGGRVGLLELAQRYKREEGETEQAYRERLEEIRQGNTLEQIERRGGIESRQIEQRGKVDERLARVRSDLDLRNDAASQRLAREIDRNEVEVVGVSPEGFIIVRDDNRGLVTTTVKMASSTLDGGEGQGGLIGAARARREGSQAPAARPAAPAPSQSESAADPTPKQAVERTVAQMVASGQLAPGTRVGETVTAPAGALAPGPVTVTWDGTRWVYSPN